MRTLIVGQGRVGSALASWTNTSQVTTIAAGYRSDVWQRQTDIALAFICTRDSEQRRVASTLRQRHPNIIIARTAGSVTPTSPTDVSAHPLYSFPPIGDPVAADDVPFLVAGEASASVRATLERWGCRVIEATCHGPTYHALATMTANLATAHAAQLARNIEAAGAQATHAHFAVAQLLRSVADNIEARGALNALTGPVVRGDAETVRAHLEALVAHSPALASAYKAELPLLCELARQRGVPESTLAAIESLAR